MFTVEDIDVGGAMDIWGRIYVDHWQGRRHPHAFVRDDGNRNIVESAVSYFEAPRWAAERATCEALHGRVLDLGCGPGSYSRFLERRGVEVVAVDSSPGAIRVCHDRGCLDARVVDFTQSGLDGERFDAILCMGNTVGIHQTPATMAPFLAAMRRLLKPGGQFVVSGVDPLETTVPNRVEYHARNRSRGLPPALVRAKLEYRGALSDWWTLWIPTEEEFEAVTIEAGWAIESLERDDSLRLWVLRPDG